MYDCTQYNMVFLLWYYVLPCVSITSISTGRLNNLEIDTVKMSGVFQYCF